MTPYEHHSFRKSRDVTIISEIILSIISNRPFIQVMELIDFCNKQKVSSLATTHRELTKLIKSGLVRTSNIERNLNIRECEITQKGKEYLDTMSFKIAL